MRNNLDRETSPYLLQHKDNPVHWQAWSPETLTAAQQENKPILLSVGYAACHWCHVMAHESFEDDGTAALMNELFVNIKVDREERPDLDTIYQTALALLGQPGGWPLTMFLTPAGEPFWGGTYFPPAARYGRPGFADVLKKLAAVYREQPQQVAQNVTALREALGKLAAPQGGDAIPLTAIAQAGEQLLPEVDPVHGGIGQAPKFPQTPVLELMWRGWKRSNVAQLRDAVTLTLTRMSQGGIYDHVGGGFARYSVDAEWLVPHFEKMLYDNAQLIDLLTLVWQETKAPLFRARIEETVGWVLREMRAAPDAQGRRGFASSLDADSEHEEGKFYVWDEAEIDAALGADAPRFKSIYDVMPGGNWEGRNILNRIAHPELRDGATEAALAANRATLFALREKRVRPGWDDKVLADWNGLMIAALVHAGIVLDEPSWLEIAGRAFDFIVRHMTIGQRLGHSWRGGKLLFPGLASDFAAMIRAGLALFEATGEPHYLEQCVAWQTELDGHYVDPDTGIYFLSADDSGDLLLRPQPTQDDATPNPNSVAAQNLVRLSILAGDNRWLAKADRLIESILAGAERNLFGHIAMLNALDLRLRGAEIVVTGAKSGLATAALKLPFVDRVVLQLNTVSGSHAAREKIPAAPDGAAFICMGERCSLPVHDASALTARLAEMRAVPQRA